MKNHLALETDGRVDLLTGLDAPEIFYRFLQKAIARAGRETNEEQEKDATSRLALVRFRLVGINGERLFPRVTSSDESALAKGSDQEVQEVQEVQEDQADQRLLELNSLAFSVAKLGKILSDMVRADENLARLGEVTFLLVAHLGTESDLAGMIRRFEVALSQLNLEWRGRRLAVEIKSFIHQQGESLLDLLERAEV